MWRFLKGTTGHMTYQAPLDSPLVATHAELLVAVEPATGRLLWQRRLPSTPTRLFRIGNKLLVGDTAPRAADARLRCFDLGTGTLLGEIALGFGIDSGFVNGDRLYVAGGSGFACLTPEGAVVWKALRVQKAGWVTFETSVVCTDTSGKELWRSEDPGPHYVGCGEGLLLGDQVAQPDAYGNATRD